MEYAALPAAEETPEAMPTGEGVRRLLGTLTVRSAPAGQSAGGQEGMAARGRARFNCAMRPCAAHMPSLCRKFRCG